MKKKVLIVGCVGVGKTLLTEAIENSTKELITVLPEEVKECKTSKKISNYLLEPIEEVTVKKDKHPFDKFINGSRHKSKFHRRKKGK